MSRTRLRNHYAVEAHFRHAGPHGKTIKAMRRQHHVEERTLLTEEPDVTPAYTSAREAMHHYHEGTEEN